MTSLTSSLIVRLFVHPSKRARAVGPARQSALPNRFTGIEDGVV